MSGRKWTPGPWFVRYIGGETQLVMGDGDVHMSDMHYYPWVPENNADWHLIAAAPDLFEALEACAVLADENGMVNGVNILAALSKAKGDDQ